MPGGSRPDPPRPAEPVGYYRRPAEDRRARPPSAEAGVGAAVTVVVGMVSGALAVGVATPFSAGLAGDDGDLAMLWFVAAGGFVVALVVYVVSRWRRPGGGRLFWLGFLIGCGVMALVAGTCFAGLTSI